MMHWYKFDISAWVVATSHLSLMEEAVYFRLINHYYDTEKPFPLDLHPLMRRLRMDDIPHLVTAIVKEFFEETPDGFRHERCDKELAAYIAKCEKNREAGKRGGRPKETKVVSKSKAKITLTKNYELRTKELRTNKELKTISPPSGVDDSVWADFQKLRKTLKAPLTETALRGIEREAAKAGVTLNKALEICCMRGWRGFKADWLSTPSQAVPMRSSPVQAAARAIFGDERKLENGTEPKKIA